MDQSGGVIVIRPNVVYNPAEVVLEKPAEDGGEECQIEFTIVLGFIGVGVNDPCYFVEEVLPVVEAKEVVNSDDGGVDGHHDVGLPLLDSDTTTYMTMQFTNLDVYICTIALPIVT